MKQTNPSVSIESDLTLRLRGVERLTPAQGMRLAEKLIRRSFTALMLEEHRRGFGVRPRRPQLRSI